MIPQKCFIRYIVTILLLFFLLILTEVRTYAARYFHIERPRLAAELLFEFEEDYRSGPNINRNETSNKYIEQLDIETMGWIYHPALVEYSLNFLPRWEQESAQSDDSDKKNTNAFLQGYIANFVFLKYKPYTITVHGRKFLTTYNNSFAMRSESETNVFGASLDLKSKVLPSNLSYTHTENEQRGFFSTSSERDEIRFRLRYEKMGGDTSIDASNLSNKQKTGSSIIDTSNTNIRLNNIYYLPNFDGARLVSLFSFRDLDSNSSNRRILTWAENLKVKHRENLSTTYSMRTEGTKRVQTESSQDSLSQQAGFGLSHSLYENLSTGINVSGGKSKSNVRATDNYAAGLSWRYTREIPWGRINVNTGHKFDVIDVRFATNLAEVTDESVTLTDPLGSFLEHEHIDISTIVITDSSQIPFIKDIDYRISIINFLTRISWINISSLPITVLVDYEYLAVPAFDYSTFNQNYGGTLNLWKIWNIHYNFNKTKQNFLSGVEPDTLSKSLTHNAGTNLNMGWSRTEFNYTNLKSTKLSYSRWNAIESITARPTRRIFINFSGNMGETMFSDDGNTEKHNGLSANIQLKTSARTNLSLRGSRNELSGEAIDTVYNEFSAIFKWFYRIYNGNIEYRFTEQKDHLSGELQKNHLMKFSVVREMF